ncbi:MAG: NmrA family transcriptional regulator, partial [Neobacillus sp.]|nr:NmrA family transcriptional regulator [Neobacillus sp.]
DVTDYIVQFALEEPKNGTVEIAGPTRANMDDFVAKYIAISGKPIKVVSDDNIKYMHLVVPRSLLVPAEEYNAGKIHFEDWALNTVVS